MTLPKMPEPVGWVQGDSLRNAIDGDGGRVTLYTSSLALSMEPLYTSDQMLSMYRAGLLRAAEIAADKDQAEAAARAFLDGDKPSIDWTMPENLGATAVQRGFFRHGWARIADAIRKEAQE